MTAHAPGTVGNVRWRTRSLAAVVQSVSPHNGRLVLNCWATHAHRMFGEAPVLKIVKPATFTPLAPELQPRAARAKAKAK